MAEHSQFSLRSKLLLILLILSLGSIAVLGYLGWQTSRDAITEAVFQHLTSVRASKAYHIESYMHFLRDQVSSLGEDEMVIRAMVRFNKTFKNLEFELVPKEWEDAIDEIYLEVFFPRLAKFKSGEPSLGFYKPESTAAHYLQYWYIANNEYEVGEKYELQHPGDESTYSEWHEHYHPMFLNFLQRFGYYDIFLIDFDSRNIVYTVQKEMDFATDLAQGPHANSGLAEVVEKVIDNPEFGAVQVVDFKPYTPSYEAPSAFLATPIFNGPHIVGILAVQLPVDEINKIMTGNENWKADGLGRSGETFLVGSDLRMRSTSRFLLEDPEGYDQALSSTQTPPEAIEAMKAFKTTILLQKVDTEASRQAIEGHAGTLMGQSYRGSQVLSVFAPLRIKGLAWAIITEKDIAEVYQSLRTQQKKFLTAGVILVMLVMFIAIWLANRFVQPLSSLIASAKQVEAGDPDVVVEVKSGDEFGQLAETLNGIVAGVRHQAELIDQKDYENRMLLENILPPGPVERLKRGDEQVADRIRQVTVLCASVDGFTELADQLQPSEAVNLLNALWSVFDEAAEAHGVEPHQTMGERYVAVCGLSGMYLDHAKRTLDFALQLFPLLQQVNAEYEADLHLRMGMHSGSAGVGIVGVKRFKYDLWGDTVNVALDLHADAEPDAMLLSGSVYEQIHHAYDFVARPPLERKGKTPLEVWGLRELAASRT
ncbi:adenylate/guanylate cyclase domain-containing protein [Candidatus Entotheonella palauensis]|uniref:adenylate/guanylate cyclase domain-containing protein n=1 Tax=Candidatus Entotheonella palauensis TaxID=93172 RepID=UPI0015C47E9A|nr:adenylate/guanylate cyclase domain-containing protein [Candidatus Entotheonella palauensis]